MDAILICPSDRSTLGALTRRDPLVLAPLLGRRVLDLALSELAGRGCREVAILAADRPHRVRETVSRGEAWGLRAEVFPETRESTVAEAVVRFPEVGLDNIFPADRLPGTGAKALLGSAREWFSAARSLIPAAARDRIGMREIEPGIVIGRQTRIDPNARLLAPCWIGSGVRVGPRATLGPGAIIEEGAFIDHDASVQESFVGPDTYIGAFTEVRRSLACGRILQNWENDSMTEVPDPILLDDLRPDTPASVIPDWIGRVAALLAMGITAPVVPWAWFRNLGSNAPLFRPHLAARSPDPADRQRPPFIYHELGGVRGLASRWPELWQIVRGRFAWVGNRPIPPETAATLRDEYERLWFSIPPGLLAPAELEGAKDPHGDEARAHASFYATHRGWRRDVNLLIRRLRNPPHPPSSLPTSHHPSS
ncbi:MAG: hypothetical protein U1G08_07445 [Verrucomicrobiota bacterium]